MHKSSRGLAARWMGAGLGNLSLVLWLSWLSLPCRGDAAQQDQDRVDFNQDIRPILASKCFACHGPDPEDRQADLRLDTFEGATESGALVPGDPETSELMNRLLTDDEDLVMPPADSGKDRLDEGQIQKIRNWIQSGGQYQQHWSFSPVQRTVVPEAETSAIDYFIRKRLKQEGLVPSPAASKGVLARRLALDLTGLPPDKELLDTYLNDDSDQAYDHLVQSLMDSPAFGEHWASYWLDLARYADTDGYADDYPRTIWPYRDWVIQAINRDLPFDQFTIQQLAGDLLPSGDSSADPEWLVATGFHRNTLTNNEGGTIDEEFRVEAVKDRVDTTMQVWNGLTFACAKCHSHKYDPISQDDYYRLYAIFNQTEDSDRPGNPPFIKAYSLAVQQQAQQISQELNHWKTTGGTDSPDFQKAFQQWKSTWDQPETRWRWVTPQHATAQNGSIAQVRDDKEIVVSGESPATETLTIRGSIGRADLPQRLQAIRMQLEPQQIDSQQTSVGRSPGNGNFVISEFTGRVRSHASSIANVQKIRLTLPGRDRMIHLAEVQVVDGQGKMLSLKELADVQQSSTAFGGDVQRLVDGNTDGTYEKGSVSHTDTETDPWVEIRFHQPQTISQILLHSRADGELYRRLDGLEIALLNAESATLWRQSWETATREPMEWKIDQWRPLRFAYASADYEQGPANDSWDAMRMIDGDTGARGWAVGQQQDRRHQAVLQLQDSVDVTEGCDLEFQLIQNYGQQHTIAHVQFQWTDAEGPNLVVPSDRQQALRVFARSNPLGKETQNRIADLEQQLAALPSANSPVMRQLPEAQFRVTHLLNKGSWLNPGHEVTAALPEYFSSPSNEPVDRLALAEWLVSGEHPLTARVTVNRIWARLMGRGIVQTEEDFGMMGTLPTHPELLDWLAVHFVEDVHWSRKELIRTIVSSETYRQAATVSAEAQAKDPDNLLLSHAPRFRLSAEQVRDQALVLGGLLNPSMYGPSVVPRLPIKELGSAFSGRTITESTGADLYRRGLYTFVRRTGPYPTTLTFDGTNRQACTIRRIRTNTPLQALVTLNDPVFFEAAQGLARRIAQQVQSEEFPDDGKMETRAVHWAFELATCRPPTAEEARALLGLYQQQQEQFQQEGVPDALLQDPIGPLPEGLKEFSRESLAAWTIVANVILNLDEVLTR